ncbi:MAG: hypothetical protein R3D58_00560 [Saprospiraceae bacterium]
MKNMRNFVLVLWGMQTTALLFAQVSAQNLYVKKLNDTTHMAEARRIIRTPDSNFLVVGYVGVFGSTDREGLVFKMDDEGNVLWAKSYGGQYNEEFYDVVYIGGYYYCVGYTRTWENEPSSSGGLRGDIFLVKLNLDGTLVWAKNMGSTSTGSMGTIGNEIGLRLTSAAQGGVVVLARINSGSNTNQNNGLIWVTPDAKVQWAYQYDYSTVSYSNELTYGIWKDGNQNYVAGGWIDTFGAYKGGFMIKVNQNGELIWNQQTNCSPGTFESQYFGYYNHANGKIYSTDHYNKSSSSIRESIVITNQSDTGEVPPSGSIPQVNTFHYGTSGSSGNNYRDYIFPVGDGYEEFILAAYHLNAPSFEVTRRATLISVDTALGLQWSKQVGYMYANNQIHDMITCNSEYQDLIGVGTVAWASPANREILLVRINHDQDTSLTCELPDNINNTTISATATELNIQRIDLNTGGCGSNCWADNDTIGNVSVNDVTLSTIVECSETTEIEEVQQLNNITPLECATKDCQKDLAFDFSKQPAEVYFEITNITGDFVIERFYGNVDKLADGFKFDKMGIEKGDYIWQIEAVYPDEKGVERKIGMFKVE